MFEHDTRALEAFVETGGADSLDRLHASSTPRVVELVDRLHARFLANEQIEIFGGEEAMQQESFTFPTATFQPPGGFNFQ